MRKDEGLSLWNDVCETDPSTTKHINARGGFTAIDAYSQIKKATEIFGPVGQGWGWDSDIAHVSDALIIVKINFWYQGDSRFSVFGCAKMDADAPKKALTDGLTKALSYLGFNADVFLGKFDDNKYVQEMRQKFAGDTKPDLNSLKTALGKKYSIEQIRDAMEIALGPDAEHINTVDELELVKAQLERKE